MQYATSAGTAADYSTADMGSEAAWHLDAASRTPSTLSYMFLHGSLALLCVSCTALRISGTKPASWLQACSRSECPLSACRCCRAGTCSGTAPPPPGAAAAGEEAALASATAQAEAPCPVGTAEQIVMFLARTSFILASDSRDADSLAVRAYSLTLFSSALALWPQASTQTQR